MARVSVLVEESLSAVQGLRRRDGVFVDDLSESGAKATATFIGALSADVGDGTRMEISEGGWFFNESRGVRLPLAAHGPEDRNFGASRSRTDTRD
jgi:hypothetical protein